PGPRLPAGRADRAAGRAHRAPRPGQRRRGAPRRGPPAGGPHRTRRRARHRMVRTGRRDRAHHRRPDRSPAMSPTSPRHTSRPLARMVALARPRGTRFALGVLLGALTTAAGVGLLSVAAWLLATAATHPPITALGVAVVATRALGVTRGVARYLERLVTHDAAFRTLAD